MEAAVIRAETATKADQEDPSVRGWVIAVSALVGMVLLLIAVGVFLLVDARARLNDRLAERNEYIASLEETVSRNRGLYDEAMADLDTVREDYAALWARCDRTPGCSTDGVLAPDEVPELEPLPPDPEEGSGDASGSGEVGQAQVDAAVAAVVDSALATYCASGTGARCQGPPGDPLPVDVVIAALDSAGVLDDDLAELVATYCADGACQGAPSTVPGAPGAPGTDGVDGRSISGAACTSDGWVVSYSDGTTASAGPCTGATGAAGKDGADGQDGRGVESMECVGEAETSVWVISYDDGTEEIAEGPCRVALLLPPDPGPVGEPQP